MKTVLAFTSVSPPTLRLERRENCECLHISLGPQGAHLAWPMEFGAGLDLPPSTWQKHTPGISTNYSVGPSILRVAEKKTLTKFQGGRCAFALD